MLKKKKFWIAGIVLVIAMGTLIYTSVAGSSVYYYSVKELKALPTTSAGTDDVRVNGMVTTDPIQWNAMSRTTSFTMKDKDGQDAIAVVYRGTVPDTFKADTEVVVRGKVDSKGIFQANELQAKCASKYTPK